MYCYKDKIDLEYPFLGMTIYQLNNISKKHIWFNLDFFISLHKEKKLYWGLNFNIGETLNSYTV